MARLRITLMAFGWIAALGALLAFAFVLMGSFGAPATAGLFGTVRDIIEPRATREQLLALGNAALTAQGPSRASAIDSAREAIEQKLKLSPTDGTLWTLQARLASVRGTAEQVIAETLKMSYFTAPNDLSLMADRLDVALRTKALADPILETLAQGDLRAILLKRPDLRDRLLGSYRTATDTGKAFLKRTSDALDPAFAARLGAS